MKVYITINFSELPVARYALYSDYGAVCLPSCLGVYQDSVLMFGIHPPCGVCVSMPGSNFERGGYCEGSQQVVSRREGCLKISPCFEVEVSLRRPYILV